jgi:hypothetical protein
VDGAEVPEILLVQVGMALVLQHAGLVLLSAAGQVTSHSCSDISESILEVLFKGYNCEIFTVFFGYSSSRHKTYRVVIVAFQGDSISAY